MLNRNPVRRMKLLIPFLFVLCTVFSCSPPVKHAQLWFFTHGRSQNGASNTRLSPVSFLYLGEDGAYTRDFGSFDYGKWRYSNDSLVLTSNAAAKTEKFKVDAKGSKEINLVSSEGIDVFELHPATPADSLNPFSVDNNRWRIRPASAESYEQLRERLINHCRFWETYFTWALNNEIQYLDVRSTPTAIKIYGNGFGLKPYDELPEAWKQCFYSPEDCSQANSIIEQAFRRNNIGMPQTESKYKMFISAFQQLESFL